MRRLIRAVPLVLLSASLALVVFSHRGESVPLWAARTGQLCSQCHFDPNGGGPRNDFGFMFARNRHSIEPEAEGPFKDIELTNKVGETMPLYFGLNQRFMLFTNTSTQDDSLDRFGFFGMENNLHLAFQPHSKLTLVYSRDAFGLSGSSAGVEQKEAFGLLGSAAGTYVKVGRFRNPFGLRLDDHTVATRNGFLDFTSGESFLPFDPRNPDQGVEIGSVRGMFYGRAAFTNGSSNLFGNLYAETKAIKFGVNNAWYQSGLSFYDEYQKEPNGPNKRATRWGYYALSHYKQLVLIGEIAAGTDEADNPGGGPVTGAKTNLISFFSEIDYAASRAVNVRLRYDYLNTNRSSDPTIRDASAHQRYAIEGEWVPVPFAELRFVARMIDHRNEIVFGNENETQFYAQAHFSY
jgi:hypothetical protein